MIITESIRFEDLNRCGLDSYATRSFTLIILVIQERHPLAGLEEILALTVAVYEMDSLCHIQLCVSGEHSSKGRKESATQQ